MTLNTLAFDLPIGFSRLGLFFEPLSRDVWVSAEAPIIVVLHAEAVDVPANEQKGQINEATVNLVGGSDTKKFQFC